MNINQTTETTETDTKHKLTLKDKVMAMSTSMTVRSFEAKRNAALAQSRFQSQE